MKVINGIVGVLSIFGAIYCLFFPGLSFINIGWVITTILGIFGICSIIFYFTKKKMYENLMIEGVHGAFGLVVGIAAAVVSILAIFVPSIQAVLDLIILIIFAIWMILDGVSSIAESFAMKKASDIKILDTCTCTWYNNANIWNIWNLPSYFCSKIYWNYNGHNAYELWY